MGRNRCSSTCSRKLNGLPSCSVLQSSKPRRFWKCPKPDLPPALSVALVIITVGICRRAARAGRADVDGSAGQLEALVFVR